MRQDLTTTALKTLTLLLKKEPYAADLFVTGTPVSNKTADKTILLCADNGPEAGCSVSPLGVLNTILQQHDLDLVAARMDGDRLVGFKRVKTKTPLLTFLEKLEKFIIADLRKETRKHDWYAALTEIQVCGRKKAMEAFDIEVQHNGAAIIANACCVDEEPDYYDDEYRVKVQVGASNPGWGLVHDTEWSDNILLVDLPFSSLKQLREDLGDEICAVVDNFKP